MILERPRESATRKWRLELFGSFRLYSPAGEIVHTKSGKLKVLLAYLALQPKLEATRKALAEALFDGDEAWPASNFAVLLSRAQKTLREYCDSVPIFNITADRIGLLADHVEIDVRSFEEQLRNSNGASDPYQAGCRLVDALDRVTALPLAGIDHPLVFHARRQIGDQILEALQGLACSPYGPQNRELILNKLQTFEFLNKPNLLTVERLMRLFAGLGMKEEVVKVYTDYESEMNEEYGESTGKSLTDLFELLLLQLDERGAVSTARMQPTRPSRTFGREETLEILNSRLSAGYQGPRLTMLTGQSGIGKTHLLQTLYWGLPNRRNVEYFDLERTPSELLQRLLINDDIDLLFIDHVEQDDVDLIKQLLGSRPQVKLMCAGNARLPKLEQSIIVIGPLVTGSRTTAGPAVHLLSESKNAVLGSNGDGNEARHQALLYELATVCEGIPLALEIAGRLSASIGLQQTINCLNRNPSSLSSQRGDQDRHASLQNAIRLSFEHLSREASELVRLLGMTGDHCHLDHLLSSGGFFPCDIEEAFVAGLVVREQNSQYVRVLKSTAHFVSLVAEGTQEEQLLKFYRAGKVWFGDQAMRDPIDLEISGSIPAGVRAATELLRAGELEDGLALFAALRPWLGSSVLTEKQLEHFEEALWLDEAAQCPQWGQAVVTLVSAHFHLHRYEAMDRVVKKATLSTAFESLTPNVRCQLVLQTGLARRCLGWLEDAVASYQGAIELAELLDDAKTLATCYFNLGSLFEAQDRLDEALEAQDRAADYLSACNDLTLESFVNLSIGRLRYRLGHDLREVSHVLEATLSHAMSRPDRRVAAEILQNLGLIYFERSLFAEAALAETVGSVMLLEFGYTEEFRRLTRSSLVTLCDALFELRMDSLAQAIRLLIDRLGGAALYAPNQALFESIQSKTYRNPTNLKLSVALPTDVALSLERSFAEVVANGPNTSIFANLLNLASTCSGLQSVSISKADPIWSWNTTRSSG